MFKMSCASFLLRSVRYHIRLYVAYILLDAKEVCPLPAWNVSWNGMPDNPSAASAVSAVTCAIGAASACAARSRASRNA